MSDQLPMGQVAIAAIARVQDPAPGVVTKNFFDVQRANVRTLQEVEIEQIENALIVFENNKSQAARALGVTTKTLYNKLHAYGLFEKYQSVK